MEKTPSYAGESEEFGSMEGVVEQADGLDDQDQGESDLEMNDQYADDQVFEDPDPPRVTRVRTPHPPNTIRNLPVHTDGKKAYEFPREGAAPHIKPIQGRMGMQRDPPAEWPGVTSGDTVAEAQRKKKAILEKRLEEIRQQKKVDEEIAELQRQIDAETRVVPNLSGYGAPPSNETSFSSATLPAHQKKGVNSRSTYLLREIYRRGARLLLPLRS